MLYQNVLEIVGNTPVVRLNQVVGECPATVFAKLEFMNPGGSIKDRIGWYLIEDAEKKGLLKPGGTVIESTSGNTGFGLAMAAAIKGYKTIFVIPDKMSEEKIKNLRAFGAKVIVTPTAVEPDDPRSYYSVSRRLAKEVPNSFYTDQYNNLANRECHYKYSGPEILRQMPDIDVFVAGIGTGGTISGVGKYLKEKKPDVKIIAVDPVGSIVYEYFKTGEVKSQAKTYLIEGIGEDFIPRNYELKYVDDMVQVQDKESFQMTRRLFKEEGLFSGVSSGAAVVGALRWLHNQGSRVKGKKALIIFPDGGNRYLSKVYDDDWMREAGFLEEEPFGYVRDLLAARPKLGGIVMVKQKDKVSTVVDIMREKSYSQIPVTDDNGWIKGLVTESKVLSALVHKELSPQDRIENVVDSSIEFVRLSDPIEKISRLLAQGKTPLVVNPDKDKELLAIITTIDVLTFLENK